MKPRIIFIHGNGTSHWSFGFSKWLKANLDGEGFSTFFETFPDSINARSMYWIPFIKDYIRAGKNDVIIGWSSGAVAAMRYAEENKILGSVLIGPSYTDLGDESEKISGFFDKPWNWDSIQKNQEKIALFYGDDDPYIPQEQFEYIAQKLKPETYKIEGGKHFIEYQDFPSLLDYILKTYK